MAVRNLGMNVGMTSFSRVCESSMSAALQGRAAASLVRLFRVLARLAPDCPQVLQRVGNEPSITSILQRLAAGEEPVLTDLRQGVAVVHALLLEHATEAGPLLQGARLGTVEEMRSYLDHRPPGVRRLAGCTLLWGARLADASAVNGATPELWAERFTPVLTGSDGAAERSAIIAMLKSAEQLLPDATPRAAAQAALTSLEAQIDELRRSLPSLTSVEAASELTRRVRHARFLLDAPLGSAPST